MTNQSVSYVFWDALLCVPEKNRIPSHLYFFIYDNFLAFYEFELILIRSLTNQHLHHKLLVAYIARLYHCTISHI